MTQLLLAGYRWTRPEAMGQYLPHHQRIMTQEWRFLSRDSGTSATSERDAEAVDGEKREV
jgi:hypothetical protein